MRLTLLFFVLFITIVSCSPEYIPNMVNTPLFTEKGEFQATVASGSSNLDVQTAFAVTDHMGVMVNGSYGSEKTNDSDDFHKHIFLEGGLGYYDKIGNRGRYEVYGGYGFGKVEGFFENTLDISQKTDAKYNRFFIQPDIGFVSKVLDGNFASRLVLVQLTPQGEGYSSAKYNFFLEPVLTSRIGFPYAKFVMQVGLSLPIGSQTLNFNYQSFIFNLGLNINLGRKPFD
ncbi:MAG: hypothetical protein MI739_10605 [Bacteroidales bacterium]|nr:hypothetical protein [Bacteroidales bacterium]